MIRGLGALSCDARRLIIEIFVIFNLAFLAVDVYVAHLANHFEHTTEWLPVAFSVFGPLVLLPGAIRRNLDRPWAYFGGFAVGFVAIVVGVAGLVFHLRSAFFATPSLKNLVYTAPFIAPLSYAGLGMLLILNRLERSHAFEHALWVTILALGGFLGNFGLSLADHAVNGFFRAQEWIPVVAAALASSLLFMVCVVSRDRVLIGTTAVVMVAEVAVGLLGSFFHLQTLPSDAWRHLDVVTHRAPPFAPMLFADLAVLALIGLHGLAREPADDSRL